MKEFKHIFWIEKRGLIYAMAAKGIKEEKWWLFHLNFMRLSTYFSYSEVTFSPEKMALTICPKWYLKVTTVSPLATVKS